MASHDRLTAVGKKFFKEIEELKKLQVRVGYQQGQPVRPSPYGGGADVVDIAMFNELGTARSPSRPFLRQSVDTNKSIVEKFCKAQLQNIARGGTAQDTLNTIGTLQKGLVQDTITKSKSWAIPNANSTRAIKGSDTPLIDEGRLLQSVNFVVVAKGGGR